MGDIGNLVDKMLRRQGDVDISPPRDFVTEDRGFRPPLSQQSAAIIDQALQNWIAEQTHARGQPPSRMEQQLQRDKFTQFYLANPPGPPEAPAPREINPDENMLIDPNVRRLIWPRLSR